MISEVTDASFREYVQRSPKTMAYFYGINCPRCKQVFQVIEELSAEAGVGFAFAKACDAEAPKTFRQMGVASVPTVIFFTGGHEVSRLSERITKHALKEIINRG